MPYSVPSPCALRVLLLAGILHNSYCCHTVTWYGLRRQNSNWEGADFTNAVVDRVSFDGSSMKVSRRDYYVCLCVVGGGYVVLVYFEVYVCLFSFFFRSKK